MAKSVRNLGLGSKITDSQGNKFIIIAHDHYNTNEVTLMSVGSIGKKQMHVNVNTNIEFANSDLLNYLNNEYLYTLSNGLSNAIKVTEVPYSDRLTTSSGTNKTAKTKIFLLSLREIGDQQHHAYSDKEKTMTYVLNNFTALLSADASWTRTEYIASTNSTKYSSFCNIKNTGLIDYRKINEYFNVFPVFNLDSTVLVSDSTSGGYYSFVFNEPPVIKNISNIKGNYGAKTDITYTVTDIDDTELSHYISFDNGSTYTQIKPVRVGDNYTYSHVFDVLGTYYCRIKVVDSANNSVTSNGFTVEVSSVAPTVNIVSVVDKVVTFKVNCLTHDISKVEILVNNSIVKTYTSGFDFSLAYEIDRTILNIGKNSIQIKATSTGGLSTYKDIEASKTTYNLPPVGTKVIIGNDTYSITNAVLNNGNQVYTLEKTLLNNVSKGQEIKINQDSVKVLCSLSNLENAKDFKEMKLVKIKKLKGQFDGYVEEKYELEGEGRYSTVKLEAERFNNNVASEIVELQQYFEYMED